MKKLVLIGRSEAGKTTDPGPVVKKYIIIKHNMQIILM